VNSKKLAIFFYEGYVSAAPTIINFCSFLKEHNFDVLLFTRNINEKYVQNYNEFPFRIQFIDSDNQFIRRISLILLNRIFKKKFRKHYDLFIYVMNSYFFLRSSKKLNRLLNEFDYIIGVDPIGLIAANNFNFYNKQLIYLSLEINYLFNNNNIYTRWVKYNEKKVHLICAFTIIQDVERMKLLCNENDLKFGEMKFHLLPNSPRPNKVNLFKSRADYFTKKYMLNQNHFIVLSAGMISDEVHSFDVVNFTKNIGESVVLVFHERRLIDIKSDSYIQSLLDLKSSNLFFSLNPVEYNQIDLVFASADIGLAIYNDKYGVNYSNILFASGKISQYLKNGKPIIVNDLPGMLDFIHSTECGIVIHDFENLSEAILKIKHNYKFYSENALKAYFNYFNFDHYCNNIISSSFNN
jgi:hypothetical protein